jgi:hypothetical protein
MLMRKFPALRNTCCVLLLRRERAYSRQLLLKLQVLGILCPVLFPQRDCPPVEFKRTICGANSVVLKNLSQAGESRCTVVSNFSARLYPPATKTVAASAVDRKVRWLGCEIRWEEPRHQAEHPKTHRPAHFCLPRASTTPTTAVSQSNFLKS